MGIGGWVKFLPVQSMTSEAVQRQPLGHSEIVAAGDWNSVFHIIKDPITPPRTTRISGLKSQVLKPTFLVQNNGEKWSRFFCFEIHRAPSELLLPSAKKSAQKG